MLNTASKTTATVIADSVSPAGVRLTTLELIYPRIIHAELKTHRMFSTNSSSSRAIPAPKFLEQVETDPAMPAHWGANQPGMVAQDEEIPNAKNWWISSAVIIANRARVGHEMGLHKQVVNRLIEPFQWMRTLVTSTEWDNFFALRDHKDADPTIQELARAMRVALQESTPVVNPGWHLPYISQKEAAFDVEDKCKISVARCCRVSYANHGIDTDYQDDLKRAEVLIKMGHWSPFEHVAVALTDPTLHSGNFSGWHQYRQVMQGKSPFYKVEKSYIAYTHKGI